MVVFYLLAQKQKMPTETRATHETAVKPEYTHKSFELVFAKFCDQYQQRIDEHSGPKARQQGRFLGLPANASVQEMGRRLSEVSSAIGEPAQLGPEHGDEIPLKDALILSARHLAWSAVMGGLTRRYIENVDSYIQKERYGGRSNVQRLFNERGAAISLKLAHNDGIREYFDSELARTLGNDSPEGMKSLIEHVPFLTENEKHALVSGIALEIAAKRELEQKLGQRVKVSHGSAKEDSVGGDLVIIGENDLVFIDVKSKMPEKFAGGEVATEIDFERGYKWIEGAGEGRQVVVWAYSKEPVSSDSFTLTDDRLAANLEAVAMTSAIDNTSV
jgi:hypothetical protein